ncbi:MAG TPA: glycosyltransferase [Verrucomicrobiae bacterium]|nr:glycosyltransferase [Verrucomicrobiae bacterium]
MSAPRYAVVTVSYNADAAVLKRQLASLGDAAVRVLVDNGSLPAVAAAARAAANELGAVFLPQARNLGLAAALNVGAAAALERAPDCAYLIFLDDDTEPAAGAVAQLVDAAAALWAADPATGLVGPVMVDAASGLSHGVHRIRGWCWTREYPGPAQRPMRCASINGSGMTVAVGTWRQLGGFDEALFLDHVDSEYSFRALHAGLTLYTVPAIRFAHRMGERSVRIWLGGWRVWPYRSPMRHRYLFRNAILLLRRDYVPAIWKIWAIAKLLLTVSVHLAADRNRFRQFAAMAGGTWAGLRRDGNDRPAPVRKQP